MEEIVEETTDETIEEINKETIEKTIEERTGETMGQIQEHYDELQPKFSIISAEMLVKPFGSVEAVTSYADGVADLCSGHGSRILDEGVKPLYVNSLQKRINAYVVAEMEASVAIAKSNNSALIWPKIKAEAQQLKGDIMIYTAAAFEGDEQLMEKFAAVRSGQGNDDLIHDMLDLSGLCRNNIDRFAPFKKFDEAWLDRAEELFGEMRDVRKQIDDPDAQIAELELLEKQAYTYLDESLSEIRKFGRLAFRNEPELLAVLKQSNRVH